MPHINSLQLAIGSTETEKLLALHGLTDETLQTADTRGVLKDLRVWPSVVTMQS